MAARRIILIGCFLGLSCSLQATGTNTNKFAIFLVRSAPPSALVGKPFDSGVVKLGDKPLLADRDFIKYDRDRHFFWVTAGAARNMAAQINPNNPRRLRDGSSGYVVAFEDLKGEPFAVVVEGKIIYIGMFCNPLSSISYSMGIPEISLLQTVPVESKEPVKFLITAPRTDASSTSSTWLSKVKTILRRKLEDVRRDRRVMNALEELGL
jgi:hypothetical protein